MADDWRLSKVEHGKPVSHVLVFDEVVAVDREDLVAEAVLFLETLPGVAEVDHVDREAVEISARRVPVARLEKALRRWWEAAKAQEQPWMRAVDDAAALAEGLTAERGYTRDGWVLTREPDAGLAHVLTLAHEFGSSLDEHALTVTGEVILSLPEAQRFTVAQHVGPVDARDDLVAALSGRLLPALDAVATVDALLDRWQDRRSIAADARRPYTVPEARLHARVLATRGRLDEARHVAQHDFDRSPPVQRPHLLRLAEANGIPPLTTGINPHLSVADEAAVAAWTAGTDALTDHLRAVTGLRLDGSPASLDELGPWLPAGREGLATALAGETPVLSPSFFGNLGAGPVPSQAWFRVSAELVTAHLGQVVMREAPGTEWAVTGDGELGLVRHGGTGLLGRVATMLATAFREPPGESASPALRRLADAMVRWIGDPQYSAGIHRPGIAEPLPTR